jgi:hypothetical protein
LDRVRELPGGPAGDELVMRDGTRLPVSRRRHSRLAERLRQ